MSRDVGASLLPNGVAHGLKIQYVLMLQHDCNLVQYVGTDNADIREMVWKSGTQRSFPYVQIANCYLYLDRGAAALYAGTFDYTLPMGSTRAGIKLWNTSNGWAQDVSQGDYQIKLNYNGTVFEWVECDPACAELHP